MSQPSSQRIVPHLWFDGASEEAATLYASLFPNASVGTVSRYGKEGFEQHGQPEGTAMIVEFMLDDCPFVFLNGGPRFKPTPAVSYFVAFEKEEDVDRAWQALLEGGEVAMPLDAYDWSPKYGWVVDRFGVSWQLSLGETEKLGGRRVASALLFVREQAGKAEEALNHYVATFPNSSVTGIFHHDGSGPEPKGNVLHAQFTLDGAGFMAMDSSMDAHQFTFSEANSFIVFCDTQEEIDHYWAALSHKPEAEQCGWAADRWGVSWQIIPRELPQLMQKPGVVDAFMGMKKLDLAELKRVAQEGAGR